VGAGRQAFLLTLVIVDDIVALTVVALAYTEDVSSEALLVALLYGVVLIMRRAGVSHGVPYFLVGSSVWIAMIASGVHATTGLAATARSGCCHGPPMKGSTTITPVPPDPDKPSPTSGGQINWTTIRGPGQFSWDSIRRRAAGIWVMDSRPTRRGRRVRIRSGRRLARR
jgi:hypothetical protein